MVGRVKTYEAIIKGQNIPKPGIPESFKVLIKELQSLGLDVKVLDADQNEIDLKQHFDEDDDTYLQDENTEHLSDNVVDENELASLGYSEADDEDNGYMSDDDDDLSGLASAFLGSDDDGDDEDEDEDDDDDFSIDDIFDSDDSDKADTEEQF